MWLTRLAISRPILIWMTLAAIAVLGIRAYMRLPAELNPRVDIPTLTVTTAYPGAGPPEVESQISKPLEDAVGTTPGVRDVYSSSQENVSIISMDFQVGTNLDSAAAEVRSRIDTVRAGLPSESRPPIVAKLDINALPILYIGLECPSLSRQALRALVDNTIRPRLERVAGVASVLVIGGRQRDVDVSVNGPDLAHYGLTIEDVVNSLKAAGHDISGGDITFRERETGVRLAGAFSSLDAIRSTQLLPNPLAAKAVQSEANGSTPHSAEALPEPAVTVADIAQVANGHAEDTEVDRVDGGDGVSIVITKSSDANTVAVVDEANHALSQLQPLLPIDLKRVVLRDDSVVVRDALHDVDASLILGAILAMIVILLFLHNLRGTLIVSLAIPACIVATFLVMWAASFTLNQMTLLALSLSVGILVDDSIVVLESITRRLKLGESPEEAALNGRAEIGFADITTTLVDVVVFVPIAFMGGIVGGFFKQFGLTIVAATLFSLVVSFTVTPMLASRWYRKGEDLEVRSGPFAPIERFYRKLELLYRRLIVRALERRALVILTGAAALAVIFVLSFHRLGFEFLPGTDQGQITVNIEMPASASLTATDAVTREVERRVASMPDVLAYVTNVGEILGGFGSIPQQGAQYAQINVRLREKQGVFSGGSRSASDEDITTRLRSRLAPLAAESHARITAAAIRSATGISAPIEIQVRGDDTNQLAAFAEQVRDRIAGVPGILDPDVSVRGGKPEVRVVVDRQKAAQFGIAVGTVGAILRDSVAGNTDSVYRDAGQEFPIRVRLGGVQQDDPNSIRNIIVGADEEGQPVTIADVADTSMRSGPTSIERNNGQRLVTITANLEPGVPLGNMQQRIDAEFKQMPHEGIDVKWGGDAETLDENAPLFAGALILAVVLVYIVMASLFNSLGTPFVIMFTLPMALIGALGALVLVHETMSLVAAIGIIMLVGLMGRNAILLLDYTNTLRARGLERSAAIVEAGATRLRPIMMTTIATIVGMLPVALRIGRASEIRAPMAIVVIGGLVVSSLLTLIVIPVLYTLFDDSVAYFRSRFAATDREAL